MIEWNRPGIEGGRPETTYAICTNPRTGSWLLGDALNVTGVAGKPGEWFSWLEEQKIRKAFPAMDYEAYVKFVCAESCTPNGVSAIKMHRRDFDVLSGKSDRPVAEVLAGAKYIWLTRQDKTRQAISYVLARATHEWWRVKGTKPCGKDVTYDERAIRKTEAELIYLDSAWEDWFTRNSIEPLRLNYEDDLDHGSYQHTVTRVLTWLGLPQSGLPPLTRLVRQSDERNEEWLKRYTS